MIFNSSELLCFFNFIFDSPWYLMFAIVAIVAFQYISLKMNMIIQRLAELSNLLRNLLPKTTPVPPPQPPPSPPPSSLQLRHFKFQLNMHWKNE